MFKAEPRPLIHSDIILIYTLALHRLEPFSEIAARKSIIWS